MIGGPIGGQGIGGAVSTDTYPPFVLRPDADIATDGWIDPAGGTTNIYTNLDEITASDSDFVQSPQEYSPTSSPPQSDLKVRLYDGATLIVEWTHTNLAVAWTDVEQVLTAPQYAAITNFANLFVEFDDNNGNVYRFALGDPPGGTAEPIKVKYRLTNFVQ